MSLRFLCLSFSLSTLFPAGYPAVILPSTLTTPKMAQKIWLKRVLIPFLVIDILFTLIYIANAIIILIAVSQLTDDDFNDTYFVQNGNDEYTNGQYQDAKRLTT